MKGEPGFLYENGYCQAGMRLFIVILTAVGGTSGYICFGCHAGLLFKMHVEIIQVGIAGLLGDFFDAEGGILQQLLCLFDSQPVDAVDAGHIHVLLEQVRKMIGADIEMGSNIIELQAFTQMLFNIHQNVVHLFVGGELHPDGAVEGSD